MLSIPGADTIATGEEMLDAGFSEKADVWRKLILQSDSHARRHLESRMQALGGVFFLVAVGHEIIAVACGTQRQMQRETGLSIELQALSQLPVIRSAERQTEVLHRLMLPLAYVAVADAEIALHTRITQACTHLPVLPDATFHRKADSEREVVSGE